jgi:hypothetical protein
VMNGVSWVNSNCIAFEIMSVWGLFDALPRSTRSDAVV